MVGKSADKKSFLSTKEITVIAMMVAFIAVASQVVVPFGPVPFTLQTMAVFIVSYWLGFKRGVIAVASYIILGAIGCPVFAQMSGGIGVIVGSTGGFIIGFIIIAIAVGGITSKIKSDNQLINIVIAVVSMLIGDVLCFSVGTVQFMFVTNMSLKLALTYCVIPFIVPDLIKMVVATIFVNRVKKYARFFD
ncbi:MAG: biotin transporter BioY [Lachnospiraceae bacterium]|nr:biotin transporter BioY [Lachnospiraceae bacterium]